MAHSLGNMVVNSALVRPESQFALSSGLISRYVMNEAAVPAEAFDTSYSSANESFLLTFQAQTLGLGFSDDKEWNNEWVDIQQNKPSLLSQWSSAMSAPDLLARPQPLYYSRWTEP
jgi:hypothetical protein